MGWLASFAVGLCTAPLAAVLAGAVGAICVDWYRIPKREGASSYFVAAIVILAFIAGIVVGMVCARGFPGSIQTFWRSLGVSAGTVAAIAVLALAICWLAADLPPRLDGHDIEVQIEVRSPPQTPKPISEYTGDAYGTIMRTASWDGRGFGLIRLSEADADGSWTASGSLELETSTWQKTLSVRLGKNLDLLFALPLPGKPRHSDMQWSEWTNATQVNAQLPSGAAFTMRYRIGLIEPPPPKPPVEDELAKQRAADDAAFRELTDASPLTQWLTYTRYGADPERLRIAAAAIVQRPAFVAEMSHEMTNGAPEASDDALRVIEHLDSPPTQLAPALAIVAQQLADGIRALDPAPPPPQQRYMFASDIGSRFAAWMVAARALQGKNGVDLVPQLKLIIEPARTRRDSHVLRTDVVRVASFYLREWGGIAPLPDDPPPT